MFSPDDPNRYRDLIDGLYDHDWFMVAADFDAYAAAQREVDALWHDSRATGTRMAIRNTAHMGWFSSDRTIRQYANEIWDVPVSRTAKRSRKDKGAWPRRTGEADSRRSRGDRRRDSMPIRSRVLGLQQVDGSWVARAFIPHAETRRAPSRSTASRSAS